MANEYHNSINFFKTAGMYNVSFKYHDARNDINEIKPLESIEGLVTILSDFDDSTLYRHIKEVKFSEEYTNKEKLILEPIVNKYIELSNIIYKNELFVDRLCETLDGQVISREEREE